MILLKLKLNIYNKETQSNHKTSSNHLTKPNES